MALNKVLQKLKLTNDKNNLVVNAPAEFLELLEGSNFDTKPAKNKTGQYDFILVFATKQSEMEKLVKSVANAGKYDALFWAAYPKKSSKLKSDMQRESVWEALVLAGLQAVSIISIDDTWSALRGRPPELIGK